ncbi:hypothetical protein FHS95_004170 [Sphingomonas naasensis]|uniref:DUF4139 domain-containing protein n=1 Tax=Sphingomonas naasensis TaxID=1344951 RepID=A0A4S1WI49_9SPHN|nr:hypothetical protein [Sphingomonas naasensis]NIJ22455.1 hypothetical protein [Sphingomonas naasensis]TGX40566.1 hypothetical protein E5A74_13670 [Sphingomonas naasensis]
MKLLRLVAACAATMLAIAPASAQVATSSGPDSVSVTIYREPGRSADADIDLEWLTGYALVTERRTVAIPAGRAVIRFEGVAGGILPESAIVTGLPAGVREKNLDADLLAPYSLYARHVGRPVTIRRTIRGKSVEERAIIRSGPDGAAVLQTKEGFVAVNCGPSRDELIYDSIPEGLTARPTLSIETDSPRAGKVTLTLSYLAWNFDWQANYVATMRPDGKSADLLAWVTLANGDVTGFADAGTMVVAGRLNREDTERADPPEGKPLDVNCFAQPLPPAEPLPLPQAAPPPVPAPMAGIVAEDAESIVVTGARMATQEELGDLKLYRIPDTTTVASMSQKQVMMFDKKAVPVDVLYRAQVSDGEVGHVQLALRAQNRKEKGLGIPLPSGRVAVFEPLGERRLLVGEASLDDKAVNEEVQLDIAEATQVTADVDYGEDGNDWEEQILTVTNANPYPIRFEGEFEQTDEYRRTRVSARLGRHNGHDVWAVTVPANGTATLRYRKVDID